LNVPKNVCTNVTQVEDINIYISYSKPFVRNIINDGFSEHDGKLSGCTKVKEDADSV
jgi:hypothetical protein